MRDKKPAIPSLSSEPLAQYRVLQALKANVEILTGVAGKPIQKLPQGATEDEVITKINEIIARLNARGE